ncbi:hypothetical protein V501_01825 [Pseudogymnoascus sp. VKM F-4519 (FW-2642)]|nr:hypothetical protein V501_01825 [Pseudogymnoascus sp. VKM F-4519 (FW-2642)]
MSSPSQTFDLFTSLRYDPLLLTCAANTTLSPSPSPFYMLSHHRDRILSAAQHFNWPLAVARLSGPSGLDHFLAALKDAVDTTSTAPKRVRAVVDREGGISVDSFEIPKRPLRNLFPTRLPPPGTQPPRVNPLTGGALTLGDDDSTVQQGPGYGEPSREQAWSVMLDPIDTSPSPLTSYKTTSRDMYNSARTRHEGRGDHGGESDDGAVLEGGEVGDAAGGEWRAGWDDEEVGVGEWVVCGGGGEEGGGGGWGGVLG